MRPLEKVTTAAAVPALFAPDWMPVLADLTTIGALASSWLGATWIAYQLIRAVVRDSRGSN